MGFRAWHPCQSLSINATEPATTAVSVSVLKEPQTTCVSFRVPPTGALVLGQPRAGLSSVAFPPLRRASCPPRLGPLPALSARGRACLVGSAGQIRHARPKNPFRFIGIHRKGFLGFCQIGVGETPKKSLKPQIAQFDSKLAPVFHRRRPLIVPTFLRSSSRVHHLKNTSAW